MSDDPDFPKANHALLVLRQARLSRNEAAAKMVHDLAYHQTAHTGPWRPGYPVRGDDHQYRIAAPRNRGNSSGCMDRNFRLGEFSQRRRICRARSLESSAQSYRELDRAAGIGSL